MKPNIVLILLDTVRKDIFYEQMQSMESMTTILNESVIYQNFKASSSWTVPSHASMFTGLYPSEHGMYFRYNDEEFFESIAKFPRKKRVITEILRESGYKTYSIASNPIVSINTAFSKGFDEIYPVGPFVEVERILGAVKAVLRSEIPGDPAEIVSLHAKIGLIYKIGLRKSLRIYRSLRQLKQKQKIFDFPNKKGQINSAEMLDLIDVSSPFFAFINLMEGHEPYFGFPDLDNYTGEYIRADMSTKERSSIADIQTVSRMKERYIEDIQSLDLFFDRLVKFLNRERIYKNTIIIITSDHGQSFGEENFVGHGYQLNNSIVDLPLIIKIPGYSKTSNLDYISNTSIYDFICFAVEGHNELPVAEDFIFSESFGYNESTWRRLIKEFFPSYNPVIRKRIWSRNGYSLQVDGTNGKIEDFTHEGRRISVEENIEIVQGLLNEIELFTGNQNFKIPKVESI